MEYQTLDEQGRKGLLTAKLRGLEGQHYEATVNAAMAQAAGLSDSAAQFDAAASEIASGIGVVAGLLGELGGVDEVVVPSSRPSPSPRR